MKSTQGNRQGPASPAAICHTKKKVHFICIPRCGQTVTTVSDKPSFLLGSALAPPAGHFNYYFQDVKLQLLLGLTVSSQQTQFIIIIMVHLDCPSTGCIKEFFEAEKYVENGIKTTNFIRIFCVLESVIKVKLFQ